MQWVIVLSVLATLVVAAPKTKPYGWVEIMDQAKPVNSLPAFGSEIPFEQQWLNFKDLHQKEYETEEEDHSRKEIFRSNLKAVEMHNYLYSKGKKSFSMGINPFADMEPKEFVSVMNGFRPSNKTTVRDNMHSTYLSPAVPLQVPSEMDWRTKDVVTPVKNQGHCGSCWSFSTTGAVEGQHARKTGKLVSLSEQNLVDCSTSYGNHGCNGGVMDYAFQYIKENDGDDTESSYPYEGKDSTCRFKSKYVGATVSGFTDVPQGDEAKLKEASATIGPISIAIDASQQSFQLYESGVYDEPECSSTQLDHGVLLVGYGTDLGQDYWLVKNSWGPAWGDEGYIKMARNKDNQCGVATMASYPLV